MSTVEELVVRGRDALARHAWQEAYEALTEADQRGSLTGEGLHLLGLASYWSAHPEQTVETLERAYSTYLRDGDRASAAMMAYRVAEQNGMRMNLAQAQGWAATAERLAEGHTDWPVQGWLEWMRGLLAWFQGAFEAAIEHYERSLEFAERSGDRDLFGMSLHDKGHALCLLGRVQEGRQLMDEAMTAVVGGELTPDAAGYVYCGMIGICSKLADYTRAAEWTEATLRWCERQSVPAFPGLCRIHRAELMLIHGSFARAEEEALRACEELPQFNLYSGLGPAHYGIGEVRRRLGNLDTAEEAFARAYEFGFTPQPGLSLLHLARGKIAEAAASIRQAAEEAGEDHCRQVRLLAAQAEIALAAGDLETATSAAGRLELLVREYDTTALEALASSVRGAVRLVGGDAEQAIPDLRRAQKNWQQVEAPYEVAEVRVLMARALRTLGQNEAAIMELRAARSAFEEMGARPAMEAAERLLGEISSAELATQRVARTFMFTDIVRSTDLVGVIGDEAWEVLLTWHDQTLRSLFAANGGEVAHHTGDGFFVAFQDARSALSCAVAVQRALAEHRRAHGFAPFVRIGVHAAEATRRGQDYSGGAVHIAARIAALAGGGEILASVETLKSADGELTASEPRAVALKGVSEPVELARIEWR